MRADFLDRGADNARGFSRRQAEALAGTARCEQSRHREAGLPGQVLTVVLFVELQVRVERRDREGEQALLEGVWPVPGACILPRYVLRMGAVIGASGVVPLQRRLGSCLSKFTFVCG